MASNIVFLVHGMGVHEAGWSKGWQRHLDENARLFAPYANGSRALTDDVAFVEITYDTVFEAGFRERWQDLATALADSALPVALRPALAELAQTEDARLPRYAWTHLLDVVLWFGFPQARQAVIARVGKQLAKGLEQAQQQEAHVHLLSHSLGTSVIHDTLLCLAAGKRTRKVFDPERGGIRWDSLVTVANVSRLLTAVTSPSDDLDVAAFRPHHSRVRPGDLVARFVNVRHPLDPFTWPRRFKPDWDPPAYRLLEPDRFDEALRVHDLETQFDHPLTARAALRLFTGRNALGTDDEMPAAWRRYEQKYGRSAGPLFPGMQAMLGPDSERKLGLGELARYLAKFVEEAV